MCISGRAADRVLIYVRSDIRAGAKPSITSLAASQRPAVRLHLHTNCLGIPFSRNLVV